MPGNEFGDRVHNFFAQENSLQGQPQPQVVEGNWPAFNDNFWAGGSQRQADVLNMNAKSYNLQDSDISRGQGDYLFNASHGPNFTPSNSRVDFGKNHSPNDQPNLNGYIYGNQFHPSRQNEVNFLTEDANSEQHHLMTSRGSPGHELWQGSGSEHQVNTSVRSKTTVPSVSFDLFVGQQQMNRYHPSMPEPNFGNDKIQFHQQHEHHQQQQQLIIRKMQDLRRQHQFQQLDLRQQNMINQYPWATEVGANWLNRSSSTMQGPSSRLAYTPNHGQTQHLVNLVPQQVEQSLYGVPISSSRGSNANQFLHKATDRSPMLQMSTSGDTLQGNHSVLPEQVGVQDGTSISRQKFENTFVPSSSQSLNTGTINTGGFREVGSTERNAPKDFLGKQELAIRPEAPNEKSTRQVVSTSNDIALDPAEEKILFGSDDNIWSAFGNAPNMSGENGNLFDNDELNGFPSIQSGSWSALMQSAVAETSSSDIGPHEEWSGLMYNNVDVSSANQPLAIHNDNVKQPTNLADDNVRMHSSLSPGSNPLPDDMNTNEVIGLNFLGHKFQNESDQISPEVSHRFGSFNEANKSSNYGPLRKSVTEGSQIYRNTSQPSLETERNAVKSSSPWAHGESGAQQQSNDGKSLSSAIPPTANSVLNVNGTENLLKNSQNNQFGVMPGEAVSGSSLWKLNSISTPAQLDSIQSATGNLEPNKVILNLNDTSSVVNSCSMRCGDEIGPFIKNNYILNRWKNANLSVVSQAGGNLDRMQHQAGKNNWGLDSLNNCSKEEAKRPELENNDMKENSNDSHRSNLSWHSSAGHKETGLFDANDSISLPHAKQKSVNQLSRKVSAPRKFQYHPMGNLDEDLEPSYGQNQPNHVQGQSSDLQKHNKMSDEELSHGGFVGYAPNMSVPFGQHFDSYTQDKASSSGQSMLELLPMVDQSRDNGVMMPSRISERNELTQLPEAANYDGSANRCQRNQSIINQGFGLQLGPPSLQRLQIPDHSVSSQKAQDTVNLASNCLAAIDMGEKSQQMVPTSLVQSSHFPNNKHQAEFNDNGSAVPSRQHAGHNMTHENFQSAFSSGSPHVNQLQNQQITRLSGKILDQHIDSSLNNNASSYMQRGSVETVLPDTSGNIKKASLLKSQDTRLHTGFNDRHERSLSSAASTRDSVRISQHFNVHDISHQGGPIKQNMGADVQKLMSQFSELTQPNIVESSYFPMADGDVNVYKGGNAPSELHRIYINSSGGVDGKEQELKESSRHLSSSDKIDSVSNMEETLVQASSKNPSNISASVFSLPRQNVEAFGRSLKPNAFSHQNYGLTDQMKDLKESETDPDYRVSKRMKGPKSDLNADQVAAMSRQQSEHNVIVGDSLGSSDAFPTEDRMPSFCSSAESLQTQTSQCDNVALQEIFPYGGEVPRRNSSTGHTSSVGADYPEVSPQMAPAWFNQYGTCKNQQILHQYDAHRETPLRPEEASFIVGRSLSAIDAINSEEKGITAPNYACEDGNTHSIPASVNEHLSSHSSQQDATDQHLVILSSKKRKSATSDLHPWHEEMSDSSLKLWRFSVAVADWNKVTNCLPEKVEYDAEFIEDGLPLLRSKRRLILTTQLMQQLFRPPPADILSADANSKYESLTYAISRTVLEDACNIISCTSGLNLSSDGLELHSAKGISSQRKVDRCPGKVVEESMGRSLRLENDFVRLDMSSSIFDLRMECQDLDKFSVINRLAKFHGRGHAENAEAAVPTQKLWPQRYVVALPMPKNLPDRVQCLSL